MPTPVDESDSHRASMPTGRSRRHRWLAYGLTIAVVTALAVSGCGEDSDGPATSSPAPAALSTSAASTGTLVGSGGITVSGTGVVSAVPDQARFSFGVRSDAATAEEALAQTSDVTSAVVAALKEAGVDESDLQTQQVSVVPTYRDDGRLVSGYTASNSVSALIRELDDTGAIVDAAVGAGANEVFGPSLDVADSDALADQALALAVEHARSRAIALASAAGVELGEIVAISESGSPVTPFAATAEASVEESFAPIEPGTREIRASVTVTFAIA